MTSNDKSHRDHTEELAAHAAPVGAAASGSSTHEVRDGRRTFKFDGVELAASTSYRPGASRWIEFSLHRTDGGSYVLSRVGQTRVVHAVDCGTATRARLRAVHRDELPADREPCDNCRPDLTSIEAAAAEAPRYWAQVIDGPRTVVAALHKCSASGTTYLTSVAARLLDQAAANDAAIEAAYRVTEVA